MLLVSKLSWGADASRGLLRLGQERDAFCPRLQWWLSAASPRESTSREELWDRVQIVWPIQEATGCEGMTGCRSENCQSSGDFHGLGDQSGVGVEEVAYRRERGLFRDADGKSWSQMENSQKACLGLMRRPTSLPRPCQEIKVSTGFASEEAKGTTCDEVG